MILPNMLYFNNNDLAKSLQFSGTDFMDFRLLTGSSVFMGVIDELISKVTRTVSPVKAGIQNCLIPPLAGLDSGSRFALNIMRCRASHLPGMAFFLAFRRLARAITL
jgi:hypothetical protein